MIINNFADNRYALHIMCYRLSMCMPSSTSFVRKGCTRFTRYWAPARSTLARSSPQWSRPPSRYWRRGSMIKYSLWVIEGRWLLCTLVTSLSLSLSPQTFSGSIDLLKYLVGPYTQQHKLVPKYYWQILKNTLHTLIYSIILKYFLLSTDWASLSSTSS